MDEVWKVVVVGGGVSGMYAAKKLSDEIGGSDILIMDKLDRWGGRLDTDLVHVDSVVVREEEGAMRFTRRNMPALTELFRELDISWEDDIVPFPMKPEGANNNRCYFRGKTFTQWYAAENPNIWSEMFSLEGSESCQSADDIVQDVYMRLLYRNKFRLHTYFDQRREPGRADVILDQTDLKKLQVYQNPEYWAFFRNMFTWPCGIQEIPLNEYSFEALLAAMEYSHSCCMLLRQTLGFLSLSLSKGNAGCVLQDLQTFRVISDDFFCFKNGYTALSKKLQTVVEQNGVDMRLQHKVTSIQLPRPGEPDNCITLKVKVKDRENTIKHRTIQANYVILALPKIAIQELFMKWTADDEDAKTGRLAPLRKLCESVIGVRCTKINLYFERDWWNEGLPRKLKGPNITSLPCAFLYPFYGGSTNSSCPAALTVYCDENNAQFWSSLQRLGHRFTSTLQESDEAKSMEPASESVVREALKQIGIVFNVKEVPSPLLTSYRCWDGDGKWGDAIHQWGLGVNDIKSVRESTNPIKDVNLFVCNEAWSDYQGWVEGSLRSANNLCEVLLEKIKMRESKSSCGLSPCW